MSLATLGASGAGDAVSALGPRLAPRPWSSRGAHRSPFAVESALASGSSLSGRSWGTLDAGLAVLAWSTWVAGLPGKSLEASRPGGSRGAALSVGSWGTRRALRTRCPVLACVSARSLRPGGSRLTILASFTRESLVAGHAHGSGQTLQTLRSLLAGLAVGALDAALAGVARLAWGSGSAGCTPQSL